MPKARHEHTYLRITDSLVKCSIPGCTHTLSGPHELLIGRSAKCPYCETTFIMGAEHIKRKKIHCLRCDGGDGCILPPEPIILAGELDISLEPNSELMSESVFADLLKARKIGQ